MIILIIGTLAADKEEEYKTLLGPDGNEILLPDDSEILIPPEA